jgi:hypothetical protein
MEIDYSRRRAQLWQRGTRSAGPVLKLNITG